MPFVAGIIQERLNITLVSKSFCIGIFCLVKVILQSISSLFEVREFLLKLMDLVICVHYRQFVFCFDTGYFGINQLLLVGEYLDSLFMGSDRLVVGVLRLVQVGTFSMKTLAESDTQQGQQRQKQRHCNDLRTFAKQVVVFLLLHLAISSTALLAEKNSCFPDMPCTAVVPTMVTSAKALTATASAQSTSGFFQLVDPIVGGVYGKVDPDLGGVLSGGSRRVTGDGRGHYDQSEDNGYEDSEEPFHCSSSFLLLRGVWSSTWGIAIDH